MTNEAIRTTSPTGRSARRERKKAKRALAKAEETRLYNEALDELRADQTLGSNADHPGLCHQQVLLHHDGADVYVDEGIAHFIEWLWDQGIDTVGSCEDCGEWLKRPHLDGIAGVGLPVADYRRLCMLFGLEPECIGRDAVALMVLFDVNSDGVRWVGQRPTETGTLEVFRYGDRLPIKPPSSLPAGTQSA